MNLIKLEDLNIIPLEEARNRPAKKYGTMIFNDEINEIGELNIGKIKSNLVNDVIPKPEEFGEPSRRNTHFMRPRYVLAERTTNFSFGLIPRKTSTFGGISLSPIRQTRYILNINGAHNREKISEYWKRGMNSVQNLSTI